VVYKISEILKIDDSILGFKDGRLKLWMRKIGNENTSKSIIYDLKSSLGPYYIF